VSPRPQIDLLERVVAECRRLQLIGINFMTLFTHRKSLSLRAIRPPSLHENRNFTGPMAVSYSIKYMLEHVSGGSTRQGLPIDYCESPGNKTEHLQTMEAILHADHDSMLQVHTPSKATQFSKLCYTHTNKRLCVDLAVRRDYSSPAARALPRPRRAPRLLVSGRTRSTSTSPCAATTRLRPHALYVDLAVCHDYSSPAALALRRPRRAPRVLVSTPPATAIYFDYAARPGASARRAALHAARRAAHR
jgi:hypothetical protein